MFQKQPASRFGLRTSALFTRGQKNGPEEAVNVAWSLCICRDLNSNHHSLLCTVPARAGNCNHTDSQSWTASVLLIGSGLQNIFISWLFIDKSVEVIDLISVHLLLCHHLVLIRKLWMCEIKPAVLTRQRPSEQPTHLQQLCRETSSTPLLAKCT